MHSHEVSVGSKFQMVTRKNVMARFDGSLVPSQESQGSSMEAVEASRAGCWKTRPKGNSVVDALCGSEVGHGKTKKPGQNIGRGTV